MHLVTKQHQSGMLHVLCLGIFPLLDSFSRLKPCNIPQVSEILFLFNFSNLRDKSQEVNIYVEEATWKPDYQLKQPFRNKRAYIYSLYTASPRVEISFDEAFLFS